MSAPLVSRQTPAPAGIASLTAPDEASAVAAARAQGRPVEALSDRTESSQTFANPTGTLTLNESVAPVRVHRADGSWVPVDRTLQKGMDGRLAPVASEVDLSFSGGGPGPLARIAKGGGQLTLGWPGRLPAPRVSSDTATYADVLPGVDLQVTALTMGFSELLVVKSAAAARSPALSVVPFAVVTSGVSLRATVAGGLSAVDGYDQELFSAPAPTMWDSSGSRSPVGVRVSDGELDLVPDLRMLAGTSTHFPVSIDPSITWTGVPSAQSAKDQSWVPWTGVQQAWTKVDACFPDQTYWRGANDSDPNHFGAVKVGRAPVESGDQCSGTLWRSYFQLDTSRIKDKVVHSATFNAYETWATSCASKPADLYSSGGVSNSTDWNRQPGSTFLQEKSFAHGYNSGCRQDWQTFDATGAAVRAANNGWGNLTLMLRAPDEGVCNANRTQDTCEWKRFDSGAINDAHTPFLSIQYDTPPNAPTGLYTEGSFYLYPPDGKIPCDSSQHFVNVTTPTLHADISDPDDSSSRQQQLLTAKYSWTWEDGSHSASDPANGGRPGNGHTSLATQVTIPAGELTNANNVKWQVVASDDIVDGPSSPTCHLTIDTNVVKDPPMVTSVGNQYPNGSCPPPTNTCPPVGTPGQFTFTPANPKSDDVAGYLYGVNTATPWKFVAASGPNNTATVTIVPGLVGDNQLFVRVISKGGNLGTGIQQYDIRTSHPSTPGVLVARWRMDESSGNSVFDSIGGHDATAAGSFSWTAGQSGSPNDHALHLTRTDQTSGDHASTMEPSVDSRYGYTVSAWVKLDDTGFYHTIVSQDGANGAGAFYLEYIGGATNRWSFSVARSDSANPTIVHAYSDAAPKVGVWTHLVGVYCDDVACGVAPGNVAQLYLYVAERSGSTPALQTPPSPLGSSFTPWRSTGRTQFGRGRFNGGYSDHMTGSIDDVTLYWGDPCQTASGPPASTCAIP